MLSMDLFGFFSMQLFNLTICFFFLVSISDLFIKKNHISIGFILDLYSIESIDECIYFYLPIICDFYYYSSVLQFDVGEGDISSSFFFIIQQLKKTILSLFFF